MKKLISIVISIVMLMTVIPTVMVSAAVTNKYQTPTITPPANTHPRVMLRESDIATIKANMSASQNTKAAGHFESLVSESYTSVLLGEPKTNWLGKITEDNYKLDDENKIEAFAFDYIINGNEASGNTAVARLIEYLGKVGYTSDQDLAYRYAGAVVFKAAEVYDWCYPLLTSEQKNTIISKCESLLKNYLEIGYPPTDQNSIVSHGSEAQLLRDMLAFGIAVYDERPDIYNAVMGRIQQEFVPARNDYYRSDYIHQGTEYGWYRFYWDLYAETLVEKMSGGTQTLFDTDLMADVLYGMIYSRRPDGRFFTEGDNKQSHTHYYNNFNQMTAKLAGDLFDNAYFKGEYRMMRGEEDFNNNNFKDERSFNSVNWLIMNNPSVGFQTDRSNLPTAKYFGSPVGKIYAKTDWVYTKSGVATNNIAAAEMKIGERYSGNHDHLDAGTFQLYFRGLMTGDYNAQDDYNSTFDQNYYKRTVAHNAITIYNSGESFRNDSFGSIANDGGQLYESEPGSLSDWQNNAPFKRSAVVNQSIAGDNSYSYIKGDITSAYNSNKAGEVARSMVFLPTGVEAQPAVMLVFDKVTSKSSSQTKKFLLHLPAEPTIEGNMTKVDNKNTYEYSNGNVTYDGRLAANTLLPANAKITAVQGTQTNGKAYNAESRTESKYEPEWGRVEIQAQTEGTTTHFLNVMTLSNTYRTPQASTLIGNESSLLVGAQTQYNQVVMFANTGATSLTQSANFTVESGEDQNFFIFGVDGGRWTVKKDGRPIGIYDVEDIEGTISFSVAGDAAGDYTVAPYSEGDIDFATVLWYDYRLSNGVSQSAATDTWYDLSEGGNSLAIPTGAQWTSDGLYVNAQSSKTVLPDIAKNTINGSQYTIEFAVSDIDVPDAKKSLSILGNVKNNFAVHKIIGADKIYLELPGWRTTLRRPYFTSSDVDGSHHIITVDKNKAKVKWYIDGELCATMPYSSNSDVDAVRLISGNGSVVYQQIKLLNVAITASEASNEYDAFEAGF